MISLVGVNVLPVRKRVTDTGFLWESELWEAGWNDLPKDKKVGVVVAHDGVLATVEFRAAGVVARVFIDEIRSAM